jgi:hypothetical protein
VSYVRVPGNAFFGMVQGQDCVLNPFSPAGKLLPKEELAALLAGQLTGPTLAGRRRRPGAAEPARGVPHRPGGRPCKGPGAPVRPHIEAAYLAQMQMANAPDVPRLLLGFDSTSTDPSFLQELGPVLQGQTANFQFVDLMLLDQTSDEGVNPYFRTD